MEGELESNYYKDEEDAFEIVYEWISVGRVGIDRRGTLSVRFGGDKVY